VFSIKEKMTSRKVEMRKVLQSLCVPEGDVCFKFGRINFDKIYSELLNVVRMCVQINFNYKFYFEMLVLSRWEKLCWERWIFSILKI